MKRWIFSGTDLIYGTDVRAADVAHELGPGTDWELLAKLLGIPDDDINQIRSEYPGHEILTVLRIWLEREGPRANADQLSNVLKQLGREDVAKKFFRREAPVAIDYESLANVAPIEGTNVLKYS